jgi:hypothetical protein
VKRRCEEWPQAGIAVDHDNDRLLLAVPVDGRRLIVVELGLTEESADELIFQLSAWRQSKEIERA